MAPRPEDVPSTPGSVTIRLPDLEPIAGLVAATARLCAHLTPAAIEAMPDRAVDALTQIQAILWRLEHARPDPEPASGEE